MTETIETGLVYIHRLEPTKKFVGCGALIEGPYIATCRHVWRDATKAGELVQVEIEFPRARGNADTSRSVAKLVDVCEQADGEPCDLVLLEAETIPTGVMALQLARHDDLECGDGFAFARVTRTDPNGRELTRDLIANGKIDPHKIDNLRQFTGTVPQGFWFTPGSSGSPVFLDKAQQLAGILSLAELGANEGQTHLREAFVVPATVIWAFVAKRLAQRLAAREGIDPEALQPVLDALGMQDVPAAEIPARLKQAIEDMRARAAQPVPVSNDGADIDATIGASRDKLGALDVQGARDLLQSKIDEENDARSRRLLPLLKERAAIERLSFDHEAAKRTLSEVTQLAPDDVWNWIGLGNLWQLTGSLENAKTAFLDAASAAKRTRDERDLSVSQNKIGDVLSAQGDLNGALEVYRTGLTIAETLARRAPANMEWQRDVEVSQNRIGDVLKEQGNLNAALDAYRAGLAIAETLARGDPGNTVWQRDLSISQDRIGDVLTAQGHLNAALDAQRAGLAIASTLARRDPDNTVWQRDLSISQKKMGDLLTAQGDLSGALDAYRAGLAIASTLARRDPANTQWQRDLSVCQNSIGDGLRAQGNLNGALKAHRAALAITDALARRDPANTQWQRDLIVRYVKIADCDPAEARRFLTRALDIAKELAATGKLAPVDAWMPDDLTLRLAKLDG